MTGAGALASEGSKAISELFSGDVGTSEVGGVFQVGINDFGRFAKTLGGAAMDNFYSDENEMQREYQRYKDNFLYNQEVRPAMLETYDEEGRDFVSFGANFVDPTLLVPGAGLIAKGGSLGAKAVATGAKAGAFAARSPRLVQLSKAMARTSRGAEKLAKGLDKASEVASIPAKLAASGTRKAIKGSAFIGSKIAGGVGKAGELTSKVAGLPRAAVTGLASKVVDPKIAGSGILGAQVTGALTGQVPGLGLLTGAEALGYLANKTGRGVERTLSALSSTGGQKRFLQRLATTADSPRLRKLALMAHAGGATKLTDLAFNSLVNGASVGALNGALAYASGEGAEGVGAAVGSGTLMGGSLPFGQPGMKGGKSQAARDQSSINFLNAKLQDDQIKEFRKLSPEARLAFATVEEAGIPRPQLAFLDKQTYLNLLREDDPNLRSAPNAHYGIKDNTIYINQDGNAGRSSKEAMDILTHELGHHFIKQAIKDDLFFAEKILSEYKTKPGEESFDFAFTTDSAGAPIDSIKLNKKAVDIADLYGGIQDGIGIGRNAEKLAQEIGAEQFAMMLVDNPNIFKTIEPSLRQKLLDGSRKVLTMFGAVDPYTGNPLDVSILGPEGVKSKNPLVQRSKSIRNLYKNYVKQREYALADKIDLAENPMKIKLQRGEKPQQAVQRLFNTKGISLKEAKAFRINNLKVKEKLVEIKKRLLENPTGGMRAFVNKSGNAIAIIGKTLTPEVRSVFTGNDPFGNINTLINVAIDGIREKAQFTFLYRAGKPSKYSDNELRPRVVSPIQLRVTGLSDNSKSAASLKLDCFDEAYLRNNAEVLVQEGFAKDPKTLIEEGRRVAKESLNDPEGRINPKGEKENELVTALFGQPESAGFIKNKKLRALLDPEQGGRLKHSIRSYDFDALAGLVPTGKDGISFDWDNVKHNHMPFDDKLFIPAYHGTPHTLAPKAGAPLGKFRTSKIGTGEGAQAYGHGLYFAGKREVADYYRKALAEDKYFKSDGTPFEVSGELKNINIRATFRNTNGDIDATIKRTLDIEESIPNTQGAEFAKIDRAILEDLKNQGGIDRKKGSLYKVELAPKDSEYLLWDKPLSEQPKAVQRKIEKVLNNDPYFHKGSIDKFVEVNSGADFYQNRTINQSGPSASAALKEAGIPGIKYLDGASRSKGEGDFNYVIFDEADVTVTEKLFMPSDNTYLTEIKKGNTSKAVDLLDQEAKKAGYIKVLRVLPKGVDLEKVKPISHADWVVPDNKVGHAYLEEYDGSNWKTRAQYAYVKENYLVDQQTGFEKKQTYTIGDTRLDESTGKLFLDKKDIDPNGIKSADSVIYDANGDTIPPSKRFAQSQDKLFMPASEAGASKGKLAEKVSKEKYPTLSPKEICEGHCFEWSQEFAQRVGGVVKDVDLWDLRGQKNLPYHVWTEVDGKVFDAETPNGVKSWKDLPYFKRHKNKKAIRQLEEREFPTKLFMPAEQAGASKPNISEAAKLWNEKGVLSKYFKKWFGKSKVVDENGDPLVVYHGTDRDFNSFDTKQIGSQFDGYDKIGFFFTTDKFQAEGFAHGFMAAEGFEPKNPKGRVLETYLNIEKPLTGDIIEKITKDPVEKDIYGGFYYEKHKAEIEKLMSSDKYDGLIIGDLFVATKPEQIKSATGNRGTFDAGERNINYMPSDSKAPKAQPDNRIQQQAPSMPSNRFMAPAASAGAKLSERFNR